MPGSGPRQNPHTALPRRRRPAAPGTVRANASLARRAEAPMPGRYVLRWEKGARHLQLSPFVPTPNDSESVDADPSGTSMALSDRLARDQQDRSLQTRGRALRTLPAPPRSSSRAAGRHRGCLVGCRDRRLAGRQRPAAPPIAVICVTRSDPYHAPTGVPRHCASEPRSDLQRTTLAQPGSPVSAVPYDPRRTGAPQAPMVECVPPACSGRPLHRAVRVAEPEGRGGQLHFDTRASRGTSSRLTSAPFESGGCRWAAEPPDGAQNDRTSPNAQDNRDGAAAAGC